MCEYHCFTCGAQPCVFYHRRLTLHVLRGFFLSSFRFTRDYCHAQEQQQERNLPLQGEITFFKNKLYIHHLQKKLRMSTARSVNKNPRTLISIITDILLSFGCSVSHLASRKKPYVSLSLLFVQSFFLFALLFLHVKAVYILT